MAFKTYHNIPEVVLDVNVVDELLTKQRESLEAISGANPAEEIHREIAITLNDAIASQMAKYLRIPGDRADEDLEITAKVTRRSGKARK